MVNQVGMDPAMRDTLARHFRALAILLVVGLGCAWSNSFEGPFVFDDGPSIVDNESIESLWPPSWLHPPSGSGETVSGRPVLNFTLAVNYALSGTAVGSYHALNLLIHACATLLLFGLARRILWLPALRERFASHATLCAFLIAALWGLHPLQTAAVTYVIQRAESLAGLFYLATLYAFVRSLEAHAVNGSHRGWSVLSILAFLLGLATKETVATAPLVALLIDRTLVVGSFRAALRTRLHSYLAFALCWILLAGLIVANESRGGTAGFGAPMGSWPYLLTQCEAIVRYLGLAFWPSNLIFDYGSATVKEWSAVWAQGALLLALLLATLVALFRNRPFALIGVWFFVVLAPSSSIVPIATQTKAEHRMYLPLAAIVAGVVLVAHRWLEGTRSRTAALGVLGSAAFALGATTYVRNFDYATEQGLWQDTIEKNPENPRIYGNIGNMLLRQKQPQEAIPLLMHAVDLDPHLATAKTNLGNALREIGRVEDAVACLREVVAEQPDYPIARVALGTALTDLNRRAEAIAEYREAMRLAPNTIVIRTNLAALLIDEGQLGEAIEMLEYAISRVPNIAETRYQLGRALLNKGETKTAIAQLKEANRLKPELPMVNVVLAQALTANGDPDGAIAALRRELVIRPKDVATRNNLANALVRRGKIADAIAEYEFLIRNGVDDPAVQHNLDFARQKLRESAPR